MAIPDTKVLTPLHIGRWTPQVLFSLGERPRRYGDLRRRLGGVSQRVQSGVFVGSRADQEEMIRAITANRLKPIIDREFPLQEIVAVFRYFESQKHFGKVCLRI